MTLEVSLSIIYTPLHPSFYNKTGVGWLIESYCPGKQYISHVGTEPPPPGYYQYFLGGKCALFKDTTRFDPRGARPLDPESEALTIRPPRSPQNWGLQGYTSIFSFFLGGGGGGGSMRRF